MLDPAPQIVFRCTPTFWKSFEKLTSEQKAAAQTCFGIFKFNRRDPRLRTHLIQRLTALSKPKRQVMSSTVEGNLRVIWSKTGNVITTEDIGTHDIYK